MVFDYRKNKESTGKIIEGIIFILSKHNYNTLKSCLLFLPIWMLYTTPSKLRYKNDIDVSIKIL
jgi:hypothetical protein